MPDPQLLNCKQLAAKLGRQPPYVTAMRAGCSNRSGAPGGDAMRSGVQSALDFTGTEPVDAELVVIDCADDFGALTARVMGRAVVFLLPATGQWLAEIAGEELELWAVADGQEEALRALWTVVERTLRRRLMGGRVRA